MRCAQSKGSGSILYVHPETLNPPPLPPSSVQNPAEASYLYCIMLHFLAQCSPTNIASVPSVGSPAVHPAINIYVQKLPPLTEQTYLAHVSSGQYKAVHLPSSSASNAVLTHQILDQVLPCQCQWDQMSILARLDLIRGLVIPHLI